MLDSELRQLYATTKNIAVVGLSDDPDRPSYQVAKYLKEHGYKIIPINPKYSTILNEVCYPDLLAAKTGLAEAGEIDIVDIFRRSEDVLPHVAEAIKIGAKVVWMQEGVINEAAAKEAEAKGLMYVMDKCIKKEHQRLVAN
ncbi:MAG: CoA-binding domain protein [Candidatus Gottesmanbacteria bacterium GW2011_GWB1_43_11]|uniref:CoA-binding domain protein n=1 Tax=Candidatus Gottesmanbacteria bacterium GW2011_GWB1_43_11 TaxID=1618446 RepID=A0A0G1ETW7_9BACT|nr:MAG: CoA-binding domain protein [Candidatus Gottesmanbacteria bacterium GW2011_GWA1_42_26]KKS80893.1 MAG: CoA-binding domain protein [Candidatus Gottesmanbacteria bacterium GW2011_GWC1_43_10]KKS86526.1 MAG: CoA-binding domain protein [Candidatus Gottesmanbacteria bacterium GW2011_GWB1_43_11]OGG08744.1 MAG: CoA-binding protein [Candidatus Gottesmanbacteria bacterium RIFCSPHIGHO2_01_FULL_43_15]OGG28272.1 MAG: CoA-binding protein [Candidatus Gottesmanbacteria bacterium RIFCSPLOWO2_01_FULL_42_10